jgi:hypothetical protein
MNQQHRILLAAVLMIEVCWPSPMAKAAQASIAEDATGTAIIDVTVVDRFGAPLENVTVRLSGVVERSGTANDVGSISFTSLPAGRYDVIASSAGFAPSVPRVLNVTAFSVTAINVTLKPFGPRPAGATLACGGFDPRTLHTLGATAHRIVHVNVLGQHTVEAPVPPGDRAHFVRTVNVADVRQAFKVDPRAGATGPKILIHQGGGRLDRGDYVDLFGFNSLPPLNVGDEYVLFLHTSTTGEHTILGAEEGTFRIRNGRVEPLGKAGAASTWARRPAGEFFTALRNAVEVQDAPSRIQDPR